MRWDKTIAFSVYDSAKLFHIVFQELDGSLI
jgi:hypothetical protein